MTQQGMLGDELSPGPDQIDRSITKPARRVKSRTRASARSAMDRHVFQSLVAIVEAAV